MVTSQSRRKMILCPHSGKSPGGMEGVGLGHSEGVAVRCSWESMRRMRPFAVMCVGIGRKQPISVREHQTLAVREKRSAVLQICK